MTKNYLYKIVRILGTPVFKFLYRPTYIGLDNIKKTGPLVIAGNHKNNLDSASIISSTKRTIHFLAKKELHDSKLGWFYKSMATIPVDRKNKNKEAMISAIEVLRHQEVIGIFPEGTFNKTSELIMPFKYGAVSMASKTKAFIVPFSITGDYQLFKKNVVICFGKPYQITSDDLEQENKILEEKVKELLLKNKK